MRPFLLLLIALLLCNSSFAAISTTINFLDNNFDGARALYPIDFDQDGDIDVLGVATNLNDVVWWENNGTETFTRWTIDANFLTANSVIAIDMDQDGDLDVVGAASGANEVAWWENTGNPQQNNWANKYSIDGAFNGANSIFVIDMDKDGDLDVLATANTGDDVSWWENSGNPKLNNWTEYTIDNNFDGASSIFAMDIDFDGDVDVAAAADTDDDIAWWENDGNPKQANWTNEYTIDGNFDGANFTFIIDIDKDGDLDFLATAGIDDDVSWWENNGDPKRNNWTEYTIDNDFDGAQSLYPMDLDFDGDIDVLAVANVADDISWWENDGTPRKNSWTEHEIKQDFDGASFVYPFDLDGDGDIDVLATADTNDDAAWWMNDADLQSGNIGFTAERKIADFFNGACSVNAIDLDIDGDFDVVGAAVIADDIIWWENDGSPADGGWIEHIVDSSFDGACDNVAIDLDRDGDIDIVAAASNDDELAWWENDGSQSFTKRTIDTNFNLANSLFVIDLDLDGDLDVVATAGLDDDLAWWANDGTPADGGWTKTTIDSDFNGANNVFCVDLDTDGDIDILATAEVSDDLAWWENDGTQNFTKRFIDDNFNGAISVKTKDLDLDGDMDVIACAYNANTVAWWANDGTPANGGWTKYIIEGNFSGASDINVLDQDLDGDIDVVGSAKMSDALARLAVSRVTSAKLADDIVWWENDGSPVDGGWIEHIVENNLNGAVFLFTSDLDRDGDIDILGASEVGDDISWWENGGPEAVIPPRDITEIPYISIDFTSLTPATTTETPSEETAIETEAALQEIDVECFIATASFGTPQADEIKRLCQFRDEYLMATMPGRVLVTLYYKISPPLARIISKNEFLKSTVRAYIKILLKVMPV